METLIQVGRKKTTTFVYLIFLISGIFNGQNIKQAQRRAVAAIPAQKIWGNTVPGVVFSHMMPKMDF